MTIIPADPWALPAIDNPETSKKINSSMLEGELFVDITNRSPAGGNLSLLISDSTIFPLFLDSLGVWEKHNILDTLEKLDIDIEVVQNQITKDLNLFVIFLVLIHLVYIIEIQTITILDIINYL